VAVGRKYVLPRFILCSKYFLSTLSVLMNFVQARNPHAVQPYLHRCFDAIAKLEFGRPSVGEQEGAEGLQGDRGEGVEEDATVAVSGTSRALDTLTSDIIAMVSPEGEKVYLRKVGTT
jgi:dynein heavy chain